MVIINEENFDTRFPCRNKDVMDKMDKDVKSVYLNMYMKYSELFNKYIIDKLKLNDYDKEIEHSELNFIPIKEDDMDVYQYLSHDRLKYLYIRNNYYIERLNKQEKLFIFNKFIFNKNNNSEDKLDDEEKNFIESTFRKVIYEEAGDNTQIYDINFGPASRKFIAPNNALVLGFRYDEFNRNNMTEKEWDDNYTKQLNELDIILQDIEEKSEKELNMPVYMIQYDEFSIKKKSITNNKEDIKK